MTYETIATIGQGGFGKVELVKKHLDGSEYAKKTLSINNAENMSDELIENITKRFIREANVQSEIDHPNIVPVSDKDLNQTPPIYYMPLATSTLEKDIESGYIKGKEIQAIMDILAGLEELHSMGIYHRDLKPQNILRFGGDGNTNYAISDFGLMSINDTKLSKITHTGMAKGTDYYTAPEIVKDLKFASAVSDIYSVGCLIHDLLGDSDRIPCSEITDDTTAYADIMRLCTRREPSRRINDVKLLREAIENVEFDQVVPKEFEENSIVQILDSSESLSVRNWEEIVTYIEDNFETPQVNIILHKINLERIQEIKSKDSSLHQRLGECYAKWVNNNSFNFNSCDSIANRVQLFIEEVDISCKVELILALLFMGTSHNRWYVERKFINNISSDISSPFAKRLDLEFKIIKNKLCPAISHLKASLDTNLASIHPLLRSTINNIC